MRRIIPTVVSLGIWCASSCGWVLLADESRRIPIELTLEKTQKVVKGQVIEHDDQGLVLKQNDKLVNLRWDDIQTSSAYQAKKKILSAIRGSEKNLTAEDHFQLGVFLAMRNSHQAAVKEFREAENRDAGFKGRIQQAWRDIRRAKEQNSRKIDKPIVEKTPRKLEGGAIGGQAVRSEMNYLKFTEEEHRQAIKAYKAFGEKIRVSIAPDLVLLETRNFLIWTDWTETTRNLIPDWAEQLYAVMCDEFGFPRDVPIWRGKCPIFCFKTKTRFDLFARTYDGYNSTDALGYTKTASDGYVHVVMKRLGDSEQELNQFATTMVHEASHAFLHCYGSSKPLPAWLNEGLADFIAERVLKDRCPTGENAHQVARAYVSQNMEIKKIFTYQQSPPGEYYPIAYSLVDFLFHRNRDGFVKMIHEIKTGIEAEAALSRQYSGMNYQTLERDWRSAVRESL